MFKPPPSANFPDWKSDAVSEHVCLTPTAPMSQDEFFDYCQQNRKIRIERNVAGDIFFIPPLGYLGAVFAGPIAYRLHEWANARSDGLAFNSCLGYILPCGSNRSPSASWVSEASLAKITPEQFEKFLPVSPEFVVEVMTSRDDRHDLAEKMREYIDNGTVLGWLIDPDQCSIHVYRPGQPVEILDKPATLSGEPEMPGFTMDFADVWNP
jgi:Uma2 family endonuclease